MARTRQKRCRRACFGCGLACTLALIGPLQPVAAGMNLKSEYRHSFRQNAGGGGAFRLFGLEPEKCVRFTQDDLLITLPAGHAKVRPNTGVSLDILIKGDFEITTHFEVIKEPEPIGGPSEQTRFGLSVQLDRPGLNAASMSRTIYENGIEYSCWTGLQTEGAKAETRHEYSAAEGRTARLRLVRAGSTLSYYATAAEGRPFSLVREYPFTDCDVKAVRLVGSTGTAASELAVRIFDLHIRAESLPGLPVAAAPAMTTTPEPERQGRLWWLIAAAGLMLLVGLFLAGCRLLSRNRNPVAAAQTGHSESVEVQCPACQKRLRVPGSMVGKRIKCPGCAVAVDV